MCRVGGGALRKYSDKLGTMIDFLKPRSAGPLHPYKDRIECGLLDAKLQRAYPGLEGRRLTRSEAELYLQQMFKDHPEMNQLYRSPLDMLDEARYKAETNWFWQLDSQAHGGVGGG
jgi:hypothetical protein